jgi:predicted nucleic acid-binding protein
MSYLLDTNVVYEMRKRDPDPNLLEWFEDVPSTELFLSVLTLAEIRLGVERLRRKDVTQAVELEHWLTGLGGAYADRIIPVDAAIADAWARLSVPDPLPVVGGLLAATVHVRNWTLVTRNVSDLARAGVRLLNPFDSPAVS